MSIVNQAIHIQTTTLNAITPTTGALSVGDTQTTGVFNLVTGVRTAAGVVNIATGTSNACAINILNGGGATTGGSVNIANGSSQTTTVNIASGTGTGTVTIGNTGNTTNLNSGTINVNGALTMGTGRNITLGTVTNDSTVLNTIVNATTNQTVTLSRVGQTYFLYRSTNTGTIPNTTNTVLHSTTVTNAGIYTINYLTRYSGTTTAIRGQGVQTWIYVSSPATYGGGGFGQVALNLVGYASPYLEMQNVGLAMTGSWTGLVNANATVQTQSYILYSGTAGGILLGGSSSNYLSITRIA